MSTFRDVHTYDGSLQSEYTKVNDATTADKLRLFGDFVKKLAHPFAIQMIMIIMHDLQNNKQGEFANLDQKNNLDCTDILTDICIKLNENSEIDLGFIEEQIVDIFRLGQCSQGRTTRFLQIWNAIKEV